MEAATEAPADLTPEEAVLIQEEMNFSELGIKPLVLLFLPLTLFFALAVFFIVKWVAEFSVHRPPGSFRQLDHKKRRWLAVVDQSGGAFLLEDVDFDGKN